MSCVPNPGKDVDMRYQIGVLPPRTSIRDLKSYIGCAVIQAQVLEGCEIPLCESCWAWSWRTDALSKPGGSKLMLNNSSANQALQVAVQYSYMHIICFSCTAIQVTVVPCVQKLHKTCLPSIRLQSTHQVILIAHASKAHLMEPWTCGSYGWTSMLQFRNITIAIPDGTLVCAMGTRTLKLSVLQNHDRLVMKETGICWAVAWTTHTQVFGCSSRLNGWERD